jgi:hypothetical protein
MIEDGERILKTLFDIPAEEELSILSPICIDSPVVAILCDRCYPPYACWSTKTNKFVSETCMRVDFNSNQFITAKGNKPTIFVGRCGHCKTHYIALKA